MPGVRICVDPRGSGGIRNLHGDAPLDAGLSQVVCRRPASAPSNNVRRFSANAGVLVLGCGCGVPLFAVVTVKCFVLLPIDAVITAMRASFQSKDARVRTSMKLIARTDLF